MKRKSTTITLKKFNEMEADALKTFEENKNLNNMKTGIELIAEERKEQLEYGFDVTKDIHYKKGELRKAAFYCLTLNESYYPKTWGGWFRENIAKKTLRLSPRDFDIEMNRIAGAFLAADIDRMQALK